MKETTVYSLVIARTLFDKAAELCLADDRYLASAGLVLLQDALEMAFYALLIEKGIDELKNLESKSFDELIGELKKAGVEVPRSGTLKALNKQRVVTKHYAQVAEPITVRNYFEAAEQVLEVAVKSAMGKSIRDILLSDLLEEGEARDLLKEAGQLIEAQKFLEALIEIRKAIFVEFENDYSVHRWRDYDGKAPRRLADLNPRLKAPFWTRSKEWIDEHVKDPLDYIQINYEKWRLDAMEWGINTAELQNLRNLTPAVFRSEKKGAWYVKYDMEFPVNGATLSNAKYCLDRAIGIILKKQEHQRTTRYRKRGEQVNPPPVYLGDNIYN